MDAQAKDQQALGVQYVDRRLKAELAEAMPHAAERIAMGQTLGWRPIRPEALLKIHGLPNTVGNGSYSGWRHGAW